MMNPEYIGIQSPWLTEIYDKYFSDVNNGFLVEIGVGETLKWSSENPQHILRPEEELVRGYSTTVEFLERGWSGVYIEPIVEHFTNELQPLLQKILTPEQYSRVQFVNCAASDADRIMHLDKDRFLKDGGGTETVNPYHWGGRQVKCRKTSDILTECKVPRGIDLMSIDVEAHELHVLRGIDFSKHTPKMIVIEKAIVGLGAIMGLLPKSYETIREDGLNAAIINKDVQP